MVVGVAVGVAAHGARWWQKVAALAVKRSKILATMEGKERKKKKKKKKKNRILLLLG